MEELNKFYSVEDALDLSRSEIKKLYFDYFNPGFAKLLGLIDMDKKFVKASGVKVWDENGNEYLDFLGGFGSLNFGHNHKKMVEIFEKTSNLPFVLQTSLNAFSAAAAYNLAQITPANLTHTFFGNSGAEAVEGAIKLARIYTERPKIVYARGSFHGKTIGALSVTGREKYQKPFKPLLDGCVCVPYGDANLLEEELKKEDVAAVLLEPIQGEGGIIVPPEGYLREVQKLCQKYGSLFILDEIQTGFGRTGRNFACEWENLEPDIMCLAKSLGGGVIPVGAFTTRKEIWEKAYGSINTCLMHTSTFGGNSLAAAAVITSTRLLIEEKLAERAERHGKILLEGLKDLEKRYEIIKEVRGKGLLIGIEFNQPARGVMEKVAGGVINKISHEYLGSMVAGELFNDYGIITAYTINNPNVIRMEPPLTVSEEEIERVLNALEEIFSRHKGILGLGLKSAARMVGRIFNR